MKSKTRDIALEFFRKKLASGTWKEGHRLPGMRELANQAGVGQTSMEQAVSLLKSEKLITVKQKSGIYAGNYLPVPQKKVPVKAELKWQMIKKNLKKDIFKGKFSSSGILPTSKELMQIYGVDFRTLKKALIFLTEKEVLLVPYKQSYRIVFNNPTQPGKTIYFILSETISNLSLFTDARQPFIEFVNNLEKECIQANLHLTKLSWSERFCITDIDNPVGFILWISYESDLVYNKIATILRPFNKPVVAFIYNVWEKRNAAIQQSNFQKNPAFFVNEENSLTRAGIEMGRFLYSKGHSKICFLSHTRKQAAAVEYYQGFKLAYKTIGISNAVVPLFYDDLTEDEKHTYTTKQDWKYEKAIQAEFDYLLKHENEVKKLHTRQFGTNLNIEIKETRTKLNHRSFFTPLFRKALTIKDATAWACYNDFLAYYGALEFLEGENIKIPEQIGIVGCYNYTESSLHNLTTWRFDFSQTARKMISLIMHPEYSRKMLCIKGTNIFHIDGMVIDRGSA